MAKIAQVNTTTHIPQIIPFLGANSQAFTNNTNFVSLASNKATILAAAGAVGGVVGNIKTTLASDNETVAGVKVNVTTDLREIIFEYEHASTVATTATAAELATANTLTIGSGTQFRIVEVLPNDAGELKVVRFKVAQFELETDLDT